MLNPPPQTLPRPHPLSHPPPPHEGVIVLKVLGFEGLGVLFRGFGV